MVCNSAWQHSEVFGRSQDPSWRWEWRFAALRGFAASSLCDDVGDVMLSSTSAVASCGAARWGGGFYVTQGRCCSGNEGQVWCALLLPLEGIADADDVAADVLAGMF